MSVCDKGNDIIVCLPMEGYIGGSYSGEGGGGIAMPGSHWGHYRVKQLTAPECDCADIKLKYIIHN